MSEMKINIVSTEFGQVLEGFETVFDAGNVAMTLSDGDTNILIPMQPDLAELLGKSLIHQARKARRIRDREAAESLARASQEDK